MAISDATGNITHEYKDVAEMLAKSKGNIEGIVGGVQFGAGKVGEDFAGMDENNIPLFETAVNEYELKIKGIIDGFNAEADMSVALKGTVAEAAHEFIASIKTLLDRYVTAIEIEKREIREANKNWKEASSTISTNVSSDSSDILKQAENVVIE